MIKSLMVNKIHGKFDYYIVFNNKLTILYGENGCGKTTILNLLNSILSGCLFDLFTYEFELIKLEYDNTFISISYKNKDLKVVFDGKEYILSRLIIESANFSSERDLKEYSGYKYFSTYPILSQIKDAFNILYLPVNRIMDDFIFDNNMEHRVYSRRQQGKSDIDVALRKSLLKIQNENSLILSATREENDKFIKSVLKSLLSMETNSEKMIEEMITTSKSRLPGYKENFEKYKRILTQLGICNENELKNLEENFYKSYSQIEKYCDMKEQGKNKIPLSVPFFVSEIAKMNTIVPFFDDYNKKIENINENLKLLFATINDFFALSKYPKKIIVGDDGYVLIQNFDSSKLLPLGLSSGEKQLVIFFTNIILKNRKSNCIYLVDEPELSLHISWQSKYTDKSYKIIGNNQLIFATHSPEIVSSYRDSMVEVVKNVSK